jgi:hypothetical protein
MWHVGGTGEFNAAFCEGGGEGKRPLERHRRRKDNIKIVTGFIWLRIGTGGRLLQLR